MFRLAITLRHLRQMSLILCCFCVLLLMATYLRPYLSNVRPKLPVFYRFDPVTPQPEPDPTPESIAKPVPFCPEKLEKPVGRVAINREAPSWDTLIATYASRPSQPNVHITNRSTVVQNLTQPIPENEIPWNKTSLSVWSPIECIPKQKLVIILPYRDRDEHLRTFLNHMHPFLRHQQLMYTILVVEQLGHTRFNRAALFNVGFRESERIARFDCFIFHDVDLLPEDDRLPYRCGLQPIHLSASLDQHNYKLLYAELFGGAVALSRSQLERIRGFSNVFFGWGGEDDDLYYRVRHHGFKVFRHPSSYARYTMLKHTRDKLNKENPHRHELLKNSSKRLSNDGYPETEYTVQFAGPKYGGLVYWLAIELQEQRILSKFNLTGF